MSKLGHVHRAACHSQNRLSRRQCQPAQKAERAIQCSNHYWAQSCHAEGSVHMMLQQPFSECFPHRPDSEPSASLGSNSRTETRSRPTISCQDTALLACVPGGPCDTELRGESVAGSCASLANGLTCTSQRQASQIYGEREGSMLDAEILAG